MTPQTYQLTALGPPSLPRSKYLIETHEKRVIPVQTICCLKEKRPTLIAGFNESGHPISVFSLTSASCQGPPTSINHLWKAFAIKSDVGGACGKIVALKG